MTAKRGPLYVQNAGVTGTSDNETEISSRESKK
jgi:hypothetical protein